MNTNIYHPTTKHSNVHINTGLLEQVTIVVNFDLPVDMRGRADCETYLHRIGRTGRFGKVSWRNTGTDRRTLPPARPGHQPG